MHDLVMKSLDITDSKFCSDSHCLIQMIST